MDWKYKHFHQERVFAAPRDVVTEAARTFMTESLGWQIADFARRDDSGRDVRAPSDKPDGFAAEGYSFSHRAIANLHIQTTAGGASSESGTKVVIDLLVERASSWGFMLFDVGGYYNIQVRKWLDGIQWSLHQQLTGTHDESQNPLVLAEKKPAARIFNGCLLFIAVMVALYFLVMFISAVVGLLTGHLLLVGRSGSSVIHGIWARILSALILLFGAFLVWRIKRKPSAHVS